MTYKITQPNPSWFKKGGIAPMKGRVLSIERRKHISKIREGSTLSKKIRMKISKSNIGKHSAKTTKIAYERILQELPELEKQGFRCIPIGKVIPDIIAIKDGKVYAIEIERSRNPRYDKYLEYSFVDEIIWILKHPHAKRQ